MLPNLHVICYMCVTSVVISTSLGHSLLWHNREDIKHNHRHNVYHIVYPKNCDRKYAAVSFNHTGCLEPPVQLIQGMPQDDKDEILRIHNNYRASVEQYTWHSAADMQKMVWDTELEYLAQKWASKCYYDHDFKFNRILPGKYSVGQNIAWTTVYNWKFTLEAWFNEYSNFHYGYGSVNGQAIGHFTQMIWASTTRLGCGYALCNQTRHFYVCNYGPTGNLENNQDSTAVYKPYTIGMRASMCPYTYDYTTGLCDCRGKVCYNGGTLDPYTCTCRCLQREWIDANNDCSMNCDNAKDHIVCEAAGGPWSSGRCNHAINIPYEYCPITCKFCPVEGQRYFISTDDVAYNPWLVQHHRPIPTTSTTTTTTTKPTTIYTEDQPRIRHHHNRYRNKQRHYNKHKHTDDTDSKDNSITSKGRRTASKDGVQGDEPNVQQPSTPRIDITKPKLTSTVTSPSITSTTSSTSTTPRPHVHDVWEQSAKRCRAVDPPSCGQPSTAGYWPPEYCYNPTVARDCPAMCGRCQGQACRDYEGRYYKAGQEWISKYGRLLCTASGVHYEIGCVRDGIFIGDNSSDTYSKNGYLWQCTCKNNSGKRMLECTGTLTSRG